MIEGRIYRVVCPFCGKILDDTVYDFYEDFDCPNCGEIGGNDVEEVYDELDNEIVEVSFDDEDEEDEDNYYDDEEEIPEGCAACGGPYPSCKTSCNIFEDDD